MLATSSNKMFIYILFADVPVLLKVSTANRDKYLKIIFIF